MYMYELKIKHWLAFTPVPPDLEELAHAERIATEERLKEQASLDMKIGIKSTYSLEEFLSEFGAIRLVYDYLEVFLERAAELAKRHGWSGEGTWMMSALPQHDHTSLVLAIKEDARDLSYVFSGPELPWLFRYQIDHLL